MIRQTLFAAALLLAVPLAAAPSLQDATVGQTVAAMKRG